MRYRKDSGNGAVIGGSRVRFASPFHPFGGHFACYRACARPAHSVARAADEGAMAVMDLSKLTASERLAVYGAIATVIGGVIAAGSYPGHWGVAWLGAILGLAMLAVIFLPQVSPGTTLPGKKGTLMVLAGGLAALLMAYIFLSTIAFTFEGFDLQSALFLVGVAGAVVMGWAGWQAFQAEGGKLQMGAPGAPSLPPGVPTPPPVEPPPSTPSQVMPPQVMPPPEATADGDDDQP
jgi:hypothetical protein